MTDQSHSFLTEADRAAISRIGGRATVREIARQVCAETGTSYAAVMGSNRAAYLCRVREVIYYMATREGFSSPQIGRVFRRDHTTILSGLRNEKKAERRGMNAHSPITRDELNLMLQEPFATRLRIPGIVQEEIAKRMAKETAKRTAWQSVSDAEHESRAVGGQRLASTSGARSQALIAQQSLKILPLHHEGKTVLQISEIVGNGTNFVRKVIREAGFQPNRLGYERTKTDYSKLLNRAHSLRMDGLSWVDIGQIMGVSKTNLRIAYTEWQAAQPAPSKDQPRLTKDAR